MQCAVVQSWNKWSLSPPLKMATAYRHIAILLCLLVAGFCYPCAARKNHHRQGIPRESTPTRVLRTATQHSSEFSCGCRLDSTTRRMACSRITDFEELCVPSFGRSGSDAGPPEGVTAMSIVDSNFTDFSFAFLSHFPAIKNVTLHRNNFSDSEICPNPPGSSPVPALQVLDVSANHLTRLPRDVLEMFPGLKILDVSDNNLNKLDPDLFVGNKNLREIYMHDNPFWCSDMEWFLDWVKTTPKVTLHDRHRINCTFYVGTANFGSVTFESLIDHCPKNCTCHKVRSVIGVYCENKGYHSFPTMLPDTSSVLHMENNHIESLQTLVNGSNYITVRFLYVDNNSIDSINILERTDFFNALNSLHISGNRLTQLPTHMIDRMLSTFLDEVKLGNNPWNCECNVVAPFHDLLIKHYQKFKDIDNIRCASDDPNHPNQAIHKLSKHDFCAKSVYMNNIDILNLGMVVIIAAIIIKVIYDYRRLKQTGQLPAGPFNWFSRRERR